MCPIWLTNSGERITPIAGCRVPHFSLPLREVGFGGHAETCVSRVADRWHCVAYITDMYFKHAKTLHRQGRGRPKLGAHSRSRRTLARTRRCSASLNESHHGSKSSENSTSHSTYGI